MKRPFVPCSTTMLLLQLDFLHINKTREVARISSVIVYSQTKQAHSRQLWDQLAGVFIFDLVDFNLVELFVASYLFIHQIASTSFFIDHGMSASRLNRSIKLKLYFFILCFEFIGAFINFKLQKYSKHS